jgi:uncharacterized protein (TIGR02147 family)
MQTDHIRIHLQNELIARCQKNPKYSLRAFARKLQVDPSLLSKVINNKRSMSKGFVQNMIERLDFSPQKIEELGLNQLNEYETDDAQNYQTLTLDHFHLISNWYHYAIFELMTISNFKSDPKWMAQKLQITVSEVNGALERMQRLAFIYKNKQGKWCQHQTHLTSVGNEFTATAFRHLQKQVLQKALLALEELPIEVRDQTSITMAIDSRLLPQAKQKIKRFRRNLCKFLNKGTKRDHVYHLGMSLYPVTQLDNGRNHE